ncbi:MAG: endonuclease III [Acidiferrobacterales bacterium]|nr:endonuclease III [Acidiferrobacterales bacterium]
MNSTKRRQIFTRFREANPNPTTELNFSGNFQLLIAVVLSAQATDKSVNAATEHLFKEAPDAQSLFNLGIERVTELIRTIGLFNSKAKNLIRISEILLECHDGKVPDSRDDLEALPGVGRKTANVILNTAFGQPTIAVDTHIFRISNRIGIAPGKNVDRVEHKLMEVVPQEFLVNAHHWLILHGRYVCTARKPSCGSCRIFDLCEYTDRFSFTDVQ